MVKILVVSSSTRAGSQSRKVSDYLTERIKGLSHSSSVFDLHEQVLPFFGQHKDGEKNIAELQRMLKEADGYVFVSPEWNGSLSAGLVNMFDFVGNAMAHKPVMLVGVGGEHGGTYPLAHMRQIGPKNAHYIISPENLIVRNPKDAMNDSTLDESASDYRLKSRAEYALKILLEYAQALESVRNSGTVDLAQFPSGV